MKFKISLSNDAPSNGAITCVGWSSSEEVYSAGDDDQLLSWSVSNNESTKVADLHSDLYPTTLHFLPRTSGSLGKHGESLLITSADGKFHVMNRNGRIERSVDAHKGAVLVGQWSNDGAGLLTAGEDGFIRIWSRGGMLRSTLVQGDNAVYDACWSPDNLSIAYTQNKFIVIKQLAPNTKPIRWKAHDNLILCLSWSSTSEFIVSGGEDCRYKVWNSKGHSIFSSTPHSHPITSVAWSPNGDLFAIGSYNTLRLCDYMGWSRSLDQPKTGTIYKMEWSSDGTQLAGACANGHVLFAHVIERELYYINYTAMVTGKKTIVVQDILNEASELLEFPERIIQVALAYSYLVATTPTQCYIYNVNNWNTPNIFDLLDGSVVLLLLCEKNFLLVERSTISIYSYQGRLVASPRWPNMRLEYIRYPHISTSGDTLVVRDATDPKTIHIIDLVSNKSNESSTTIQHPVAVIQVALDQTGIPTQRTMAVLDRNRDLYVVQVRSIHKTLQKIGTQIQSFQWNSEENMLVAIQDVVVVVWYFPSTCFNAKLLNSSSLQYNSTELGRNPKIDSFTGNLVFVRKADGTLINVPMSPFPAILHKYIRENKWNDAIRLCRVTSDQALWTGLAVLATQSNNTDLLDIAEEAFAAINHFDKVSYIQHIKHLPNKAQQLAGAALLGGSIQNSETILLHNGLVFQAILNNVQLHNWNQALELALKNKAHVDIVLYLRQKYLNALGKDENNSKFLSLHETVNIDKEKIQQKLEAEYY